MTRRVPEELRWLERARRHERFFVALIVLGSVIFALALAHPRLRSAGLATLERALVHRQNRWGDGIRAAERALAAGNLADAERDFVALNASHPARIVRQGLDKERERILLGLAELYEAQGRRGRALDTYDSLIAFEPLNYLNHFARGSAIWRLSRTWAVPIEARDAFAHALLLWPNHLPSLRGYVAYHWERAEFGEVTAAFERFQRAVLVQPITVVSPSGPVARLVTVNGQTQHVTIPVSGGEDEGELLIAIRAGGLPAVIDSVVLRPSPRVGLPGTARPASLQRLSDSTFSLGRNETAAGSLSIYLSLSKPMDRGLWDRITQSYRNLLDETGLRRAATGIFVFASEQDADSAWSRLEWNRSGRLHFPDEDPFRASR